MALTLQEQIMLKTDDFKEMVTQAVLSSAISIFYEANSTTNYEERRDLAKLVIISPNLIMDTFINLVATRITSIGYSDQDILNAVSSIWTVIAKSRY